MKALKLSLFALLVSMAITSCQKDEGIDAPQKTIIIPIDADSPTYWKFHYFTSLQPPRSGIVRIDGTMALHRTYHVRHYTYVNNREYRDTIQHELRNDSIFFTTKDIAQPKFVSGPHYIKNDTLYTVIPPGVFYK